MPLLPSNLLECNVGVISGEENNLSWDKFCKIQCLKGMGDCIRSAVISHPALVAYQFRRFYQVSRFTVILDQPEFCLMLEGGEPQMGRVC